MTLASENVSPGDPILASQYNNLRADMLKTLAPQIQTVRLAGDAFSLPAEAGLIEVIPEGDSSYDDLVRIRDGTAGQIITIYSSGGHINLKSNGNISLIEPLTLAAPGECVILLCNNWARWIPIATNVAPTGTIRIVPRTSAPSAGWLLMDGRAFDTSRYSNLYTYLGGRSTLPDMRGRVPIGLDNMGGTSANRVRDTAADTLFGTGGKDRHRLTQAEMPSHAHGFPVYDSAPTNKTTLAAAGYANPNGSATTTNTGGNQEHENMPPYMAFAYAIRV